MRMGNLFRIALIITLFYNASVAAKHVLNEKYTQNGKHNYAGFINTHIAGYNVIMSEASKNEEHDGESGPCVSEPCQNDGTCKIIDKKANCTCKRPYTGDRCEKSPCEPNPCKNEGICEVKDKETICSCKSPFIGTSCEQEDKCISKCGNDESVKCIGNPLVDEEVFCDCKDETQIFDSTTKECKIDYCKTTCGKQEDVICEGDPFGNNVTCLCSDAEKTFVLSEKKCKEDQCKIICGTNEGVKCDDEYAENVTCICEDESKSFDKSSKLCKNTCSNNPCQNGGTCITAEETFKCICKEPYAGLKCDTNTRTLKRGVIILSVIVIIFFGVFLFLLIKWRRRGEYEDLKN